MNNYPLKHRIMLIIMVIFFLGNIKAMETLPLYSQEKFQYKDQYVINIGNGITVTLLGKDVQMYNLLVNLIQDFNIGKSENGEGNDENLIKLGYDIDISAGMKTLIPKHQSLTEEMFKNLNTLASMTTIPSINQMLKKKHDWYELLYDFVLLDYLQLQNPVVVECIAYYLKENRDLKEIEEKKITISPAILKLLFKGLVIKQYNYLPESIKNVLILEDPIHTFFNDTNNYCAVFQKQSSYKTNQPDKLIVFNMENGTIINQWVLPYCRTIEYCYFRNNKIVFIARSWPKKGVLCSYISDVNDANTLTNTNIARDVDHKANFQSIDTGNELYLTYQNKNRSLTFCNPTDNLNNGFSIPKLREYKDCLYSKKNNTLIVSFFDKILLYSLPDKFSKASFKTSDLTVINNDDSRLLKIFLNADEKQLFALRVHEGALYLDIFALPYDESQYKRVLISNNYQSSDCWDYATDKNAKKLAIYYKDTFYMYNVPDLRLLETYTDSKTPQEVNMSFSPNGKLCALYSVYKDRGGIFRRIRLFNENGLSMEDLPLSKKLTGVTSFSNDGKRILCQTQNIDLPYSITLTSEYDILFARYKTYYNRYPTTKKDPKLFFFLKETREDKEKIQKDKENKQIRDDVSSRLTLKPYWAFWKWLGTATGLGVGAYYLYDKFIRNKTVR